MISATAPGKVMLWGEYAVLTGAPAAMLAVDRYARCTIEPQPSGWSVQTPGFADEPLTLTHEELLNTPATGARALQQALLVLADNAAQVPSGGSVILDTREFHYNQHKLGIGSSAAIATATCQAVATLLSCDASFAKARQVHDQLQGKRGSGADVAAAWFGGALRYQEGQATPLGSIALSNWSFWWTGQAASTSAHVQRFQRWSADSDHAPLDALSDASCALFECLDANTLRRLCSQW